MHDGSFTAKRKAPVIMGSRVRPRDNAALGVDNVIPL